MTSPGPRRGRVGLRAATRWAFKIHGWVGLVSGLLLLNVGLTGAVLVFADDINEVLWRDLLVVAPRPARLPYAALYESVRRRYPEAHAVGIGRLPTAPDRSVVFDVGYTEAGETRSRRVFVDPYSGEVLGVVERGAGLRADPMRWLYQLHISLRSGRAGYAAIGFLSVLLVVSLATGLLVYRRFIVRALLFQVPVRLRDWRRGASDLHRVIGVWAWLFNLMMAATGFWFMRDVFTPDFYRRREPPPARRPAPPLAVSIDDVLVASVKQVPDFVPHGLFVVRQGPSARILAFFGDDRRRSFLLSPSASVVWFDARTGHLAGADLVSRRAPGAKVVAALGPLHFGRWGGGQVKALYALFALAPPVLSVTGFTLWLRRRRRGDA